MAEHTTPVEGPGGTKFALELELESLKKFQGRVNDLLKTLDESDGAPKEVADTRLAQDHLGQGFQAAKSIYDVYHDVQSDLAMLSKLISDQVTAMGSAVLDAHNGYANTDAAERDRLWAIHKRMQHEYDARLDPDRPPPHTSRTGPRTDLSGTDGAQGSENPQAGDGSQGKTRS
ncbi:hypothetical protein IPZ58_23750 [Streptomyces roseoverticillatus]|uniref:hypothetical protein n=1 Tax=Streptomyces roseoverticillatus TaxID=66429 RepID=UPI001F32367A|nr:hypothetical protein [Streptomyces roseoverticillatus]MCF3104582.1 hypothetical protein [Streptomyces roseoverticillatus]